MKQTLTNLAVIGILLNAPMAFASAQVEAAVKNIDAQQTACLNDDDNSSTAGRKMCVGTAIDQMDDLLNSEYQKIMQSLAPAANDDSYSREDKAETKRRLLQAQRTWIKFRDADAELSGITSLGGTAEGLEIGSALYDLTKARVLQLDNLFN